MDSEFIQSKSWPEFAYHNLIQRSIYNTILYHDLEGQDKLVFCISLSGR